MNEHFITLFDYDRYTNLLITDHIGNFADPAKPVKLMAHLLSAQQIWLARCLGEPCISGSAWPDWTLLTIKRTIDKNYNDWISFIDTLGTEDFMRRVTYKNSKGDEFSNRIIDVLTQVINHGTHHRAQIGQFLKVNGEKLPQTDFIYYLRALHKC
jgi:uncharacterized damage-inducible protein DinB